MDSELFDELEGNLKEAVVYTSEEKLEHEIQMLRKELERLTPKGLRDESKRTNSKGSYSRASSH